MSGTPFTSELIENDSVSWVKNETLPSTDMHRDSSRKTPASNRPPLMSFWVIRSPKMTLVPGWPIAPGLASAADPTVTSGTAIRCGWTYVRV